MRHRPLNEMMMGINEAAKGSLRRRIKASVTHATTGSRCGPGEVLVRPVSSVGGTCGDGCGTGPDSGPKLDMRDILASVRRCRQADNLHEISRDSAASFRICQR